MFLMFFTVLYVLFGSSCGFLHKEVCYGNSVDIDLHAHPFLKKLYFSPREGGLWKLLMVNQEAKDPRLKVSTYSVKLTQLTEKDNGKFVIVRSHGGVSEILSLTILDCSTNISLFYGEDLVHDVPSNAELLEFTPFHSLDQPQLLWERANPHNNYGGRGKVSEDVFRISKVTQEDNGNYNFRQEDKSMVSMLRLTVKEKTVRYEFEEHKDIFIPFPWASGDWTVTFKKYYEEEDVTVMQAGSVIRNNNPFFYKMKINDSGIDIPHIEYSEHGTFKFRDPAGNLVLVSEIIPPSTVFDASIIFEVGFIAVVAFLVVCCCCCCKKCCCKNEKPPSEVAQTASEPFPEPKVFYHDLNEPAGSGFSAPPTPAAFCPPAGNAGIPHDAAAASSGPVAHQPTNGFTNISQPEVTHQASEQSAPSSSFGYNPLSSDYQPVFEVKGLSYTLDLPLSTENSSKDVYNSNNMNFL